MSLFDRRTRHTARMWPTRSKSMVSALAAHEIEPARTAWKTARIIMTELRLPQAAAVSAKLANTDWSRQREVKYASAAGVFGHQGRVVRLECRTASGTGRCNEGATAMTNIGTTLREVADTYDAEDRASMHRIKNVY